MSDLMDKLLAQHGLLALPARHVERCEQLWMAGKRDGGLQWRPPYHSRCCEYPGPSGLPSDDHDPGPFWTWLMLHCYQKNMWRDDPVGDLAKDIWRDEQFPKNATPSEALNYISGQRLSFMDKDNVLSAIATAIELYGKGSANPQKRDRYRYVSQSVRFTIMQRDNYTCQTCGSKAPDVRLEIDHRQSVKDGGTNDESNLWTLCFDCNRGKAGRSL